MINLENLYSVLQEAGFTAWVDELKLRQTDWLIHHGDYPKWSSALAPTA